MKKHVFSYNWVLYFNATLKSNHNTERQLKRCITESDSDLMQSTTLNFHQEVHKSLFFFFEIRAKTTNQLSNHSRVHLTEQQSYDSFLWARWLKRHYYWKYNSDCDHNIDNNVCCNLFDFPLFVSPIVHDGDTLFLTIVSSQEVHNCHTGKKKFDS